MIFSARYYPRGKFTGRVLLLLAWALGAPQARAAGVVSPCTEASLNAALVGGGAVTFACSGTIILTGTKTLSSNTTIEATGQSVTLNGNNAVRLFIVNGGITASFTNLTFTAGSSTSGSAISNVGMTTITNSTFSGNSATSDGGAIFQNGDTLTITNSSFSNNSTASDGGAIDLTNGTLTITNSSFSNNSTANFGGAIHRALNASTTVITNSTFSGNSAGLGGAISNGGGGAATVTNTTFSGNSSIGLGGAIYNTGSSITITNSTFSGNSSATGGAIYINAGTAAITNATFSGNSASDSGGAINRVGGTTTVRNSILSSANGGECGGSSGTITDGGYNLSTDANCGFTAPGSVQNVLTEQLALGALGANGGPTQSILPRSSSIAVDTIPAGTNGCATTVATDQRGVARPQHSSCDIGAVEIPYRVPPRLVSE